MKKKIIAIAALAVILLSACLLVGCKKNPEPTPQQQQKGPDLVLDAKVLESYSFIRKDTITSKDTEIISLLTNGINNATGYKPMAKSDFLYPNDTPAECEILIGETTRAESVSVYASLKYSDYVIERKGSKIVIAGGSYDSEKAAVEYFLSLFKDGKATFADGYRYEHKSTYNKDDIKIEGVSVSEYQIVYSATTDLNAANIVKDAIGAECGIRVPVVKANAEKTDYEIIIGKTNRGGIIDCDYYCYKITGNGNKITLHSYDTIALNAAARKLADSIVSASEEVSLSSLKYEYVVPTKAELIENIDSLYMRWEDSWQPPEDMLDYEAKKKAIVNVSDRLMTCAHRADSYYYPENSLESIISFYKMGGDVVELDVQATKDGVLILMHDTTLSRMTNASDFMGKTIVIDDKGNTMTFPNTSYVDQWTYEQIQYLNLKEGWGNSNKTMFGTEAKLTPFKVPTLAEALEICKNRLFILPDKAQAGNGGQWRYADIDGVQDDNKDYFLYDAMKEANNYESIILSYGYLSSVQAVTVQKWIKDRTGVAPLIIVRNDSGNAAADYNYLKMNAVPDTFGLHIGGAYSDTFESRYATVYSELKGKVLLHGWTILYKTDEEGGGIDDDADNTGTWQKMYDLGYRMIMTNNYLELVKFAAEIYEGMN